MPNGPLQRSTAQPSQRRLPFRSRYQRPVLGRKTPIRERSSPTQSPTTGRSPLAPKSTQPSTSQPSQRPSPSSRYHRPVAGRNTPMRERPTPVQSPLIGRSPFMPNAGVHTSTAQPSNVPLPFASRAHRPVDGRKM